MINQTRRSSAKKQSVQTTPIQTKNAKKGFTEKIIIDDEIKEDNRINSLNSYSFKSTIFSSSESKKKETINFNFDLLSKKKMENKEKKEIKEIKVFKVSETSLKDFQFVNKNIKIKNLHLKEKYFVKGFEKLSLKTLNSINVRKSQNNIKLSKGNPITININTIVKNSILGRNHLNDSKRIQN